MMNVRFPSVGFLSLTATPSHHSIAGAGHGHTHGIHQHPQHLQQQQQQQLQRRWFSTFLSAKKDGNGNGNGSTDSGSGDSTSPPNDAIPPNAIRIGIVGGGLAGVTVAHALATRHAPSLLQQQHQQHQQHPPFHVTVLEGDPQPPSSTNTQPSPLDLGNDDQSYCWSAATARNANCLVPGVSMHVFSRPATLVQVLQDTAQEWWAVQRQRWLPAQQQQQQQSSATIRMFERPPAYFSLHLWRCLGPSAEAAERWSFVHFLWHFLYTTAVHRSAGADERGRLLHQLAAATRASYLDAVAQEENEHPHQRVAVPWGHHSRGFLSLHRTEAQARHAVAEARAHGEEAERLPDWQSAVQWVPQLHQLQSLPLTYHAVRRPNDYAASCELFVRHWQGESVATGLVDYRQGPRGKVSRVEQLGVDNVQLPTKTATTSLEKNADPSAIVSKTTTTPHKYRVTTADGSTQDFDMLVLASGPTTPLLADQLGALRYCPTYPLRGHSLTIFFEGDTDSDDGKATKSSSSSSSGDNLVRQPFSLDTLYCSSVTPGMARLAGFGELVGYSSKAQHVPSLGPKILSNYARHLFPNAVHSSERDVLQCFRAISPDDLPLAGEVPTHPGLFLHTGHGTLGWTCGLATGECLAQSIVDRMNGNNTQDGTFTLHDGSKIDRQILSPKRFG